MISLPRDRQELADIIGYAMNNEFSDPSGHAADAILAAGYRKPRTITTRAEVESLYAQDDSVVLMDEDGLIVQSLAGGWASPSFNDLLASEKLHRLFGPTFTVLHEPEAGK